MPCKWYGLEVNDSKDDGCCAPGRGWAKHRKDGHGGLVGFSKTEEMVRKEIKRLEDQSLCMTERRLAFYR